MSETNDIFFSLKSLLRSQGITYKALALKLNLSEASIKRMFSLREITLSRLESICTVLQIHISELIKHVELNKKRIVHLSVEQEQELVSDKKLLLVSICVLNHWNFENILEYYLLTEHELIRYMAKLDKMKILELLPGNRFKMLIDPDFHWINDGPIQRFFNQNIRGDFMNCQFDKPNEVYLFRSGMLSETDNLKFQQTLRKTANEFIKTCRDTSEVPIHQRHGTAIMIAMRPWVPQIFDEYTQKK